MQAKQVVKTFGELATPAPPRGFAGPVRLQTSIAATQERRLLRWMCRTAPRWLTPDQLTALGVLGAAVAGLGYAFSNLSPAFIFLASFGIFLNWLGDSLDGSLARYREIERPRYGYLIDHSIDSLNGLLFALGLGITPYVSMAAALFLICGFYLLSIHVFLAAMVDKRFRLTFIYLGPTELRLLVVLFNGVAYVLGPVEFTTVGVTMSIYSCMAAAGGAIFVALFLFNTVAAARNFRRQDKISALEINASGP